MIVSLVTLILATCFVAASVLGYVLGVMIRRDYQVMTFILTFYSTWYIHYLSDDVGTVYASFIVSLWLGMLCRYMLIRV